MPNLNVNDEQRKLAILDLQNKIKRTKQNLSKARRTLKEARAELSELIELEEFAIEDEKERIDHAGGNIRTALGKDKYGQVILPGSFASDVYITRRNREILEPGLRNKIQLAEKHIKKFQKDIQETRQALINLRVDAFTASLLSFLVPQEDPLPPLDVMPDESVVPSTEDILAEMDVDEESVLSDSFEKLRMFERLEKIKKELRSYNDEVSDRQEALIRAEFELMRLEDDLKVDQRYIERFHFIERRFLYRFIEMLMGLFGVKTKLRQAYEKNLNHMGALDQQIDRQKTVLSNIQSILLTAFEQGHVLEVELNTLTKSMGATTKKEAYDAMLQIISREKPPEIKKLIKKCEDVKLDYIGRHVLKVTLQTKAVKCALKSFLESPTTAHVDHLNQVIQDNPLYSKSFSTYRLLRDAHLYYPDIMISVEALLPMKPIVLEDSIMNIIEEKKDEMRKLQERLGEVEASLKGDLSLIAQVLQNKEALENAYITLIVLQKHRQIFIEKNKPSSTVSEKVRDKYAQAEVLYDHKINEVKRKIGCIKENLPLKVSREVDEKIKRNKKAYEREKSITPFVLEKTQSEREELLLVLNQVVVVSLQIEDGMESGDIDIPYRVNLRLKSTVLPEGASEKIEERFLIHDEITKLRDQIRVIEDDAGSTGQSLQAEQQSSLIQRCRERTLLHHSMTKALGRFIMIPTSQNLEMLKNKMEADPSYIENEKLLGILEDASKLYPDLIPCISRKPQDRSTKLTDVFKSVKIQLSSVREAPQEIDVTMKPPRN